MQEEVIERHLQEHKPNVVMAARGMLNAWKASQTDGRVAYDRLCEALRHQEVNMNSLVKEVLQ